jgi:hypothetical protein
MSLEQANQFVAMLLESDTLLYKLAQCCTVEERLSVALDSGYDVYIDDFKKLSEVFAVSNGSHGATDLVNNDSSGNACHTYAIPGPKSFLINKNINRICHIIIRSPEKFT